MPSSKAATRKYQRQLDAGFADLRFDGPLEQEFREVYAERQHRQTYIGLLLGALLYSVFLVAKLFIDSGPFLLWTSILRGCIICAILLTVFLVAQRRDESRHIIVFLDYWFFGVVVSGIEIVTYHYGEMHHYEGIFFACFHCFLFGGMLLRQSCICAAGMIGIYTALSLALGLASSALAYQIFFLILAAIMGGATLHQMEFAAREAFLRRELLKHMANRDSLTDIATRSAFSNALTRELRSQASSKDDGELALVLIDLDYFKQLNDSRGHNTGDKALKLVSRIVTEKLGGIPDGVGRWGGDELVACVKKLNRAALIERLELVRREVESLAFMNEASPHGRLTVSLGAIMVDRKHRESVESLLHRADEMLYSAKSAGRNCVRLEETKAK